MFILSSFHLLLINKRLYSTLQAFVSVSLLRLNIELKEITFFFNLTHKAFYRYQNLLFLNIYMALFGFFWIEYLLHHPSTEISVVDNTVPQDLPYSAAEFLELPERNKIFLWFIRWYQKIIKCQESFQNNLKTLKEQNKILFEMDLTSSQFLWILLFTHLRRGTWMFLF